ncbi:uncharacterized protein LOC119690823 isoform X2 [Plutella xylostella]|uniref:uncharacterized protein LOC119690823 isoform X2 n=1 Tax=Plutella xylostella TaxID=51655 RepID=UPI002032BC9E|nr:uncharacterized protein LOC119690823 isoform X2 [Plutella xylostella]
MGRSHSVVWRFYERLIDDGRTYAVLCKLCDTQYKFFGNTTNLKSHLVRKHPIQWELGTGCLDDIARQSLDDADEVTLKRTRNYKQDKNHGDTETEAETDIEESNRGSLLVERHENDEEWLEDDPYQTGRTESYEPKKKKVKTMKVKREVISPPRRRESSYYQSTPLPRKVDREIIYRDPPPIKDEYSVFGEYVANKLRKFKAPRTRGNIQQLITTILWQAEYGMYDNADSVKRVISIPTETALVEADTETTEPCKYHITIGADEQNQTEEVYAETTE